MHDNNSKRPSDQAADGLLIARIQAREAGWKDLFGQLVQRHQSALYGRCLGYLKNPDDAADASQDALLRAYRAIDSFKGDAAFRTWLFAIADNQCHTLARKRSRHVVDGDIDARVHAHRGDEAAVEPAVNCDEVVHQALGQITPIGRDVLHLRYFAELSIEEIAVTLGVGISAAKMRLYRAQDQVAALLETQTVDYAA